MTIDPTLAGLVTGALGLALLLAVLAVRALRARRRPVEAAETEAEVADVVEAELVDEEPVEVAEAEVEVEPADRDREPLAVRSLRAQVRTLEQTIEDLRELTDRLPATEPAEAPADEEPAAAYRRQVELSLRALAARPLPEESAAHALARAVAAVERLDGADRLARPALPRTAGEPAAAPAAPVLAAPAPAFVPAPAVPAPAAVVQPVQPAQPVQPLQPVAAVPTWSEPTTTLQLDELPEADLSPAVPEVEVVLPVPPPLVAEPRRNRRWRRHAA